MSFDYYHQVNAMSEDKLIQEVERLTKALYKMDQQNAVYGQVQDMIAMAQEALQDKMYLRKYKEKPQDEVLEIGTISSEVKEITYSDEELLNIMVTAYTTEFRDDNNE
jgi:uncharacterized coiled-coil DUF342 family protein